MRRAVPALLLLALLAAGCTTIRETQPERTATEQLLLSTAADRAVHRLGIDIPEGARVYVDTAHFEAYDGRYVIGAIRERLLREGATLVPYGGDAEVVVEVRSGALSIDREERLVGIPSFRVPIPFAGDIEFPEIAFFKRTHQRGIAKLALTSFAAEGGLEGSSGPVYGFSSRSRWVLLMVGWTTDDLIPEGAGD